MKANALALVGRGRWQSGKYTLVISVPSDQDIGATARLLDGENELAVWSWNMAGFDRNAPPEEETPPRQPVNPTPATVHLGPIERLRARARPRVAKDEPGEES